MGEDRILSLSEYRSLLVGMDYEDSAVNLVVNLKIKHSVLGIIGKDDRPASKRKVTVNDLIEHINRCYNI